MPDLPFVCPDLAEPLVDRPLPSMTWDERTWAPLTSFVRLHPRTGLALPRQGDRSRSVPFLRASAMRLERVA